MPWPLVRAQNVAQEYKPPEDIKIWVSKGAGEEGSRRRRTGCQGIEKRTSSGTAGTGLKAKAGRGGEWFEKLTEDVRNKEGSTHRG